MIDIFDDIKKNFCKNIFVINHKQDKKVNKSYNNVCSHDKNLISIIHKDLKVKKNPMENGLHIHRQIIVKNAGSA